MAEQESTLREKIKHSVIKEKALEKARNSTVSVKTVADLTTEVVAQTIEKITVYEKTHIKVMLRSFDEKAETREGA